MNPDVNLKVEIYKRAKAEAALKQEATLLFSVCLKIVLIGMTLLFLMAVAHAASPCLIYLKSLKGRGYELQAKRHGQTIGHMLYYVEDHEATIAGIYVNSEDRRTGVSEDLIAHMIVREPHVTEVSALLVLDNYDAMGITSEIKNHSDCAKHLKRAPIYKVLSKFGFTKVLDCTHVSRADSLRMRVGM